MSINKIAKRMALPKSTISTWVRDVVLTKLQRKDLKLAAENTSSAMKVIRKIKVVRRQKWEGEAKKLFKRYSSDPIFMLGLGIYWGEGDKFNVMKLTNTDVEIHKVWVAWVKRFIPTSLKLVGTSMVHPGNSTVASTKYWRRKLGIEIRVRLFKPRKTSKKRKNLWPYGVLQVITAGKGSTEWHFKLMTWIRLLHMEL
jgi:hypothetical protein